MKNFKQFILNENLELAASAVHAAWRQRNPKADWNAAQHVPYEKLPEEEKEKDRLHVRMIGDIARKHRLDPTNPEHHVDNKSFWFCCS